MFDAFKSVLLYLGVFGLCYVLFCTSERQLELKDGHSAGNSDSARKVALPHLAAFIAIIVLSLLAALRADSVGVDTDLYPDSFMKAALSYTSFGAFLNDPYTIPSDEPMHAVVVWVCSRITASKALLLFFYQLLTVVPVYAAACRLRNRISISVAMAVYMFFFYNNSLNLMRQSIACAFVLLAFSYFMSDRRISLQSCLFAVLGLLFHRSAIYGILLMVAATLVLRLEKPFLKYLCYALIALAPVVVFQVASFLVSAGIADYHVQVYLKVFQNNEMHDTYYLNPFGGYSIAYLCMYGWLVFLPSILQTLRPNRIRDDTLPSMGADGWLSSYCKSMTLTGYLIYVALLFGLQTQYGSRFSLYFDFLLIVSLALSCKGMSHRSNRFIVLCSLICVWFIWVILLGWSGSGVYYFNFEQPSF